MGKFEKVDPSLLRTGDTFRRPVFRHVYTILGESRVGPGTMHASSVGTNVEQFHYFDVLIVEPNGHVSVTRMLPLPRWKPIRIKRLGSLS